MKKNYLWFASLGLVQLALLSTVAHAQDTTRVLSDVVVTATKVGQKQSQIGKTVTIISRKELERSSGKSVAELLNEQAGIIVNGAGGNPGLNKSVYLRGADNKYTLILLDGVLVSDPSDLGGAFDLRLLSVDQIDHIEILKGGQSTLYGSDAIAGVINIVTKKGGDKGVNINGLLTAGSYGTLKGSIGLNSQVKAFSYNIIYSHERSNGVSEALQPPNSPTPFDKDGYNQDALNAQFGIKVTSRLNINPFVRYFYGNYKYDDGGFADNLVDSYNSKHFNTGTNAVYTLRNGSVNLNYSYENTDRSYHSSYGNSPYVGRLNFADLYFNHQLGGHVKILAGIDNRYSQINAAGKLKVDSSANLLGAYASVFLNNLASVFNLEAGTRYNHQTNYGNNWTYSVTPSFDLIDNNKLRLFGTVSTSFKSPDLTALFGQYGPNPGLKPERSHSYEAGVGTSFFENRLNMRLVAYQRNVTDAIVYLYPKGYINQDKQNVKGIEFEPTLYLGQFSLKGYFTHLKGSSISKDTLGRSVPLNYLYRRPENTYGLFAGVQLNKRTFISLNDRYYSSRNDLFYNSVTYGNELHLLKGYNLVDAYAEYAIITKGLKAFIDVKNLFNEKYSELYGYTTLGTNFNLGLSFNITK